MVREPVTVVDRITKSDRLVQRTLATYRIAFRCVVLAAVSYLIIVVVAGSSQQHFAPKEGRPYIPSSRQPSLANLSQSHSITSAAVPYSTQRITILVFAQQR